MFSKNREQANITESRAVQEVAAYLNKFTTFENKRKAQSAVYELRRLGWSYTEIAAAIRQIKKV